MTLEENKEHIRRYSNGLWGMVRVEHIDKMINEIFDDHEAQLKAKDEEIRRLNNLYADTIKDLGDALIEIERLKEESKQSYIEGSKSCDDLLSFYITKIASLEEKLKVSNDSAIK